MKSFSYILLTRITYKSWRDDSFVIYRLETIGKAPEERHLCKMYRTYGADKVLYFLGTQFSLFE